MLGHILTFKKMDLGAKNINKIGMVKQDLNLLGSPQGSPSP